MFEQTGALEVAKWTALVFLAGFIGFFGKALGRAILAHFEKKKGGAPESPEPSSRGSSPGSGPDPGADHTAVKDSQKSVKKALKAQEKAVKKANKD
jgi:hypothetical protein